MILSVVLLASGCQFYRQVVVSKEGVFLPWRDHRDNPKAKTEWYTDHLEWEIADAHNRYGGGLMDHYRYNQIQKNMA